MKQTEVEASEDIDRSAPGRIFRGARAEREVGLGPSLALVGPRALWSRQHGGWSVAETGPLQPVTQSLTQVPCMFR